MKSRRPAPVSAHPKGRRDFSQTDPFPRSVRSGTTNTCSIQGTSTTTELVGDDTRILSGPQHPHRDTTDTQPPTASGTTPSHLSGPTIDALEQSLVSAETLIGQLRAHQIDVIRQLDPTQIHIADGARSMQEWVAARADIAPETASALVGLALAQDTTEDRRLAAGATTFDRACATHALRQTDATDHAIQSSRASTSPAYAASPLSGPGSAG